MPSRNLTSKYQLLAPRIESCSALVVYISSDTKDSAYVNWEIEYAHKRGKRIVGVWARGERDCEVPEMLDKYADAIVGWRGDRIIEAINGEMDGFENPDGSRFQHREIVRYICR